MEYIADTFYKNDNAKELLAKLEASIKEALTNNLFEIPSTFTGNLLVTSPSNEDELHSLRKGLNDLKDILAISEMDGTWNYDEYFLGMHNALVVALSCFTREEPEFHETPETWLYENAINESDSLLIRLTKVIREYYKNHVGEICPPEMTINLRARTNMVPNYPVGSDCVYDNPDAAFLYCAEQENPSIGQMYPNYMG